MAVSRGPHLSALHRMPGVVDVDHGGFERVDGETVPSMELFLGEEGTYSAGTADTGWKG